jgi:hypothetical protein
MTFRAINRNRKKKKLNNIRSDLEAVNPKVGKQLICFLTGTGGSGKSNVRKGIVECRKKFCKGLGVGFTKRTIVATALAGAAVTLVGGNKPARTGHAVQTDTLGVKRTKENGQRHAC